MTSNPTAWTVGAGAVAVLAAVAVAAFWAGARRGRRRARARTGEPAAKPDRGTTRGDLVAAAIATAVSADGMWTTFHDLHMAIPLRAATFAFLEVAVWQSARRAQRSMRENYAAGVDGIAMWVLTCVSAVLSASHEITQQSPNPAIVLVRLVAPLVAAWGWERNMKLERRRRRGLGSGVTWRFTLDRIAVKLGLAEVGERGVDEVDAHRRLAKVARAADRARTLKAAGAKPSRQARALARAKRAYADADEYAKLSNRPEMRQALLEMVSGQYNVAGFVEMRVTPWWADAVPAAAPDADADSDGPADAVHPARASDKLMRVLRLRRASEEAMRAAVHPELVQVQPPTDADAGAPVALPERTRPADAVHLRLPTAAPDAAASEGADAHPVDHIPDAAAVHPPQVSGASECASAPASDDSPAAASEAADAHLSHVDRARDAFADDLAAGRVPSLRRIQTELRVGQRRAQQVQSELRSLAS